jgi:hypothetical protein
MRLRRQGGIETRAQALPHRQPLRQTDLPPLIFE